MSLEQVRGLCGSACYDLQQHPVKGDDNYYIVFTSGTTGKPKGLFARLSQLLPTGWLQTRIFNARASPNVLTALFFWYLSVMYWAPTLALGEPIMYQLYFQGFEQLFATISLIKLDFDAIFADMAMLSEFQCWKRCQGSTHFYTLMGKSWPLNKLKKLRRRFPMHQ